MSWLEIISVLFNLVFLFCLIKEKRIGWLFGIAGSFLSIFLFYQVRLYAEAFIYGFYTIIGVYGWISWGKIEKNEKGIERGSWKLNALGLLLGSLLALVFGYYLQKVKADYPYWDAFTSVFALFASYLEAKKYLETWYYWIVINLLSVFLYYIKGLEVYSGLMIVYFVSSIVGLIAWQKSYNNNVA